MTTGTLRWLRRLRTPILVAGAIAFLAGSTSLAEDSGFFRIGTGSTGGTYFPIGGLIANAVSSPPGSRPCDKGGSCGVPGLIAAAVSTIGSVANIEAIAKGDLESGLSQADVAYWAYTGTSIFRKKGKLNTLRAIANLYPESVHLVVRADSKIKTVADLKRKRISLGEKGSGTLVEAEIILRAYGLRRKHLKASYIKLGAATDQLAAGKLDGFFMVAGAPAAAIEDLAGRVEIRLVPIAGKKAIALVKKHRFFAAGEIPEGVYQGVPTTPTLTVGAQWVVAEGVGEDLVYELTRALWHENTRKLLDKGHPKGQQIRLETALVGIAIPLHPGAARYYSDIGMLSDWPASDQDADPEAAKKATN